MTEDGKRPADAGGSGPEELTCEESLARVYEYLDGELDVVDHDAVRKHLQKCRKCYPHFDFERLFLDYVHELGATEASNPELAGRVREMIASEAS